MTYRGHVENGMIQLQGSVVLPEGPRCEWNWRPGRRVRSQHTADRRKIARHHGGRSQGGMGRLPADLTDHLDHYIYGTPK